MAKVIKRPKQTNEGEGSRTADRRYRAGVDRHVRSGRSTEAAEEAKRALEGDEGEELERAEQQGKQRASTDMGSREDDREQHLHRGRE